MNFDTRTVIDLTKIDKSLHDDLLSIIDEEQLFSDNIGHLNSDQFIDSISPLIKDCLKRFIQRKLKDIDLQIVKGLINLSNVDYRFLVDELTK